MIDSEELYKVIPKKVEDWTTEDVNKWFQINDISVQTKVNMNGKELLSLTPTKLLKQLKVSHFLARKISDWLEFEVEDFQQYLAEMSDKQVQVQMGNKKQIEQVSIEQQLENYENLPTEMCDNKKRSSFQEDNHTSQSASENEQKNNSSGSQQQSTQIYKPLKYKANKANQKKNNFFSGKDEIKERKVLKKGNKTSFQKKDLVLNELVQNSENRQEVPTCKHLPENSQYFGKSKQVPSEFQQSCSSGKSSNMFDKDIRFVSSQLMIAQNCSLIACFNDNVFQIQKYAKIGRSTCNDIILKNDGVSRSHAQIIVEEEKNESGQLRKRYFLRDVGSKFGTFVQVNPERPKKIKQQESYCIGCTTICVQRIKILKGEKKFDLYVKITLEQEQLRTFTHKSIVTIGNRKKDTSSNLTKRKSKEKKDIQLDDYQVKHYHCRFVLLNDEVYLEQVEGNIMERINKNQRYQFVKPQNEVRFGDENVTFCLETNYKALSNLAQLVNQ